MKKMFYTLVGLTIILTTSTMSAAIQADKDMMLHTMDIIQNSFQVDYAPKDWKKKYSGWELDKEIENAKDKIRNTENITIKQFQRIVRDFFNSTKDYHVNVVFYSTEFSTLPFGVKGADNRYFITYIDRSRLSPTVFPCEIGDELVTFDGRPTDDVVQEIKNTELSNSNEDTDQAEAENYLTIRTGMLGHIVPKGPVTIAIRSQKTGILSNYQIIWQHHPEKIESKSLPLATDDEDITPKEKLDLLFNKKLVVPIDYTLNQTLKISNSENLHSLSVRKSFIPTLGKVWWESDSNCPFHAYLFETDSKQIVGYIRIPHYVGNEDDALEFAKIIELFQDRSDALIIDQNNNPGGSVFYLYALASMLTDQPLAAPRHRMTITQKEVNLAVNEIPNFEWVRSDDDAKEILGETYGGIPVTYQMAQFFLNYFRFILDEWNAGRTLTNPFYLYGIDHINPHPTSRYTKPILLLTNSRDFSGGDFLPAILQDSRRVTILGERTAGAGGYVKSCTFPNQLGIAYCNYTASIAERVDKNPIENLGVQPDIVYHLSTTDLQQDYIEYVDLIKQTIDSLLFNE